MLYSAELAKAMGDDPAIIGVLLTVSDGAARLRLGQREIGAALETHLARSSRRAAELDRQTPVWVHRLGTDGRTISELGAEVLAWLGWDESP